MRIYEVNMEQFRNIDEVLAGNFALPTPKTDRVLKSTRIEQAIFDDLSADAEELAEFSAEGSQKLKSFGSLVNDVFQSVYGLRPRYYEVALKVKLSRDEQSMQILDEIMENRIYDWGDTIFTNYIRDGFVVRAVVAGEPVAASTIEANRSAVEAAIDKVVTAFTE